MVCASMSSAVLWHALGMLVERLGVLVLSGLGAGKSWELDMGWLWMVACVPDKVVDAREATGLLSTMGWPFELGHGHH